MIELHHHHHFHFDSGAAPSWVAEFRALLEKIMATLEEVLADVTAESTALDSISTLITGLKDQLAAALAGTGISPAVQAQIDAIFTQAEANKAKIAAALAANVVTPPA